MSKTFLQRSKQGSFADARPSLRRNGSALIIVLGLLSVLMLMAMAFIIAMRTERGGASNQRHAITARKMLDTAIARAMADLDDELLTVVDRGGGQRVLVSRPTPPWMIYASTNRATVAGVPVSHSTNSVLTHEAAKHLPPDQSIAARFAYPGWLPITGGIGNSTDDDAVLGRYSYIIINNAGYLDANRAHGNTNRAAGVHYGEIRLADGTGGVKILGTPAAANALSLSQIRDGQIGRYESMAEFLNRTALYTALDDFEASPRFQTNSFHTWSYAMESLAPFLPGSVAGIPPYGRRLPKVDLSKPITAEKIERIRTAFSNSFAAARTASNHDYRTSRSTRPAQAIPYYEMATAALLDYIDDDNIPGGNGTLDYYRTFVDGSKTRGRPCTEPVPMFSAFRFNLVDANWGAPGPAEGTFVNTLTFRFQPETVYLHRTIPPRTSAETYRVHFGVSGVNVGSGGLPPSFEDAFVMAATDACRARTYDHKPSLQDRTSRQQANNGSSDFVVTFDGNPASMPEEIMFQTTVWGEIHADGNIIQEVLDIDNVLVTLQRNAVPNEDETIGWAFVTDPRFASFAGNWKTSDWGTPGTLNAKPEFKKWYDDYEPANFFSKYGPEYLNPLMEYLLLKGNATLHDEIEYDEWSDPLHFHGGTLTDDYGQSRTTDNIALSGLFMTANKPIGSVGELGHLPLAPLRTVSLYDHTFKGQEVPRHTVLDYFTAGNTNQYRVNLNPPYNARVRSTSTTTEIVSNEYQGRNLEPLTAVLADLPLNELPGTPAASRKPLSWSNAERLAQAFWFDNMQRTTDFPATALNYGGRVYDLSTLGRKAADSSKTLARVAVDEFALPQRPTCDFEREALIRNSVELLTTRQQIFTIIVQADAFTPKFGFDNADQGTTLASALAIVEVWRDPEPIRNADGTAVTTGFDRRVTYRDGSVDQSFDYSPGQHQWFIRYLHQF